MRVSGLRSRHLFNKSYASSGAVVHLVSSCADTLLSIAGNLRRANALLPANFAHCLLILCTHLLHNECVVMGAISTQLMQLRQNVNFTLSSFDDDDALLTCSSFTLMPSIVLEGDENFLMSSSSMATSLIGDVKPFAVVSLHGTVSKVCSLPLTGFSLIRVARNF